MLVLSRKGNQRIIIDGQIRITIVECSGSTVKVGIEAPQSMKIVREEIDPWAYQPDAAHQSSAAVRHMT
ncbi:MAG: carbon storage regulator [Pirellulaceae bacterium]